MRLHSKHSFSVWFCPTQCFCDFPMSFQTSENHSFSMLSGIPLSKYAIIFLIHSKFDGQWVVSTWGNYFLKSIMNILVHAFYKIVCVLGSWSFLKYIAGLLPTRNVWRVSIVLLPHHYLILSAFLIFAILVDVKLYLSFICFSLMYHFMCTWTFTLCWIYLAWGLFWW